MVRMKIFMRSVFFPTETVGGMVGLQEMVQAPTETVGGMVQEIGTDWVDYSRNEVPVVPAACHHKRYKARSRP